MFPNYQHRPPLAPPPSHRPPHPPSASHPPPPPIWHEDENKRPVERGGRTPIYVVVVMHGDKRVVAPVLQQGDYMSDAERAANRAVCMFLKEIANEMGGRLSEQDMFDVVWELVDPTTRRSTNEPLRQRLAKHLEATRQVRGLQSTPDKVFLSFDVVDELRRHVMWLRNAIEAERSIPLLDPNVSIPPMELPPLAYDPHAQTRDRDLDRMMENIEATVNPLLRPTHRPLTDAHKQALLAQLREIESPKEFPLDPSPPSHPVRSAFSRELLETTERERAKH
jgi:hypothetical protein